MCCKKYTSYVKDIAGDLPAELAEANAKQCAGIIVLRNLKGFFLTKKMYKPKYTKTTCMTSPVQKAATRNPNCSITRTI